MTLKNDYPTLRVRSGSGYKCNQDGTSSQVCLCSEYVRGVTNHLSLEINCFNPNPMVRNNFDDDRFTRRSLGSLTLTLTLTLTPNPNPKP